MQRLFISLLLCLHTFVIFAQVHTVHEKQQQQPVNSNNKITSSPSYSTFTLNTPASTSAGVYDAKGTLLRTLWSGKNYNAGTYAIEWDGKDDAGNSIPLDGKVFKI